jgi:hypothetical protein
VAHRQAGAPALEVGFQPHTLARSGARRGSGSPVSRLLPRTPSRSGSAASGRPASGSAARASSFQARQAGTHGAESVFGHAAVGLAVFTGYQHIQARGLQGNVAREVGAEDAGLEGLRAAAPGQARLDMAAALQRQVGVARS